MDEVISLEHLCGTCMDRSVDSQDSRLKSISSAWSVGTGEWYPDVFC